MCLGGIPGDHLIVPVSINSVPSPMHLRLGQKDKVSTEYQEENDAMGTVDTKDEVVEKDSVEFGQKGWQNNEVEMEEEGDKSELEWMIPGFPFKSTPEPNSQQYQCYGPRQKAQEDGYVTLGDGAFQDESGDIFKSHLSKNRDLKGLKRWQHLQSHGGLGFRLTQQWKSWRQRAQWVCSQGHLYNRRWLRYSPYGKQRRVKRNQQSLWTHAKNDGNDERLLVSERGTNIHYLFFRIDLHE